MTKQEESQTDPYIDRFGAWKDVQQEFQADAPEPDEVLFAGYSYEDYSGTALVVYRNGDKYYWATGSHCSCYGLEGQWGPEEYDGATLIAAIDRKLNEWNYFSGFETKESLQAIKEKIRCKA